MRYEVNAVMHMFDSCDWLDMDVMLLAVFRDLCETCHFAPVFVYVTVSLSLSGAATYTERLWLNLN